MTQESRKADCWSGTVFTKTSAINSLKNEIIALSKNATAEEAESLFDLIWNVAFNLSFSRNLSGMTQHFADGASYTALLARRSAASEIANQGQEPF